MASAITLQVSPDEPCFGLAEMNLQGPSYRGFHRYQIVYVIRADHLAEHREDLGLAARFHADQFRIPGGVVSDLGRYEIVHTVGELRDIADQLRFRSSQAAQIEPSDLVGMLMEELEEAPLEVGRISSFGPFIRKQRD